MERERLSSYCLECILGKQEKNIQAAPTEEMRSAYRKEIEKTIAQRKSTDSAPVVVARLNRVQEKFLGKKDIYGPIKQKYNRIMMELSDTVRTGIESSEDPLAQALMFARAGNFIDFGAMHQVDDDVMHQLLEEAPKLAPEPAVYGRFLEELEKAEKIVCLTDNCGEIVLDGLLLEQIRKRFPHLKVTVVVRGEPVLNDATMEDAQMVGLTELDGVRVIENGTSVAGTELTMISEEALAAVKEADLIISKGQGNFETLHGCGLNIYYLFLCKCDWFTMNLGLPRLSGVFEREAVLIKRWKAAQEG